MRAEHGDVAGATGRARPGLAYCDHGPKNCQSRRVAGVSPSAGGKRPKFGRIDPFCLMAVLPVLLVAGILGALVNVGLGLACAVFAGLIVVFDSWVNRPSRRRGARARARPRARSAATPAAGPRAPAAPGRAAPGSAPPGPAARRSGGRRPSPASGRRRRERPAAERCRGGNNRVSRSSRHDEKTFWIDQNSGGHCPPFCGAVTFSGHRFRGGNSSFPATFRCRCTSATPPVAWSRLDASFSYGTRKSRPGAVLTVHK